VSPDLSHATVYFLPFGMNRDVDAVAEALGSAAGFLRSNLGKQLNLRHVPQLHFKVDTTLEQAVTLSAKINDAVADDRRRHVDDPNDAPGDAAVAAPPPATEP
jgi:ribosome-binding factor A